MRSSWRELLAHLLSWFSVFGAVLTAIQESFVCTVVEVFTDIDLSDEKKDDRKAQTKPFWMDFARFVLNALGLLVIVCFIFVLIGLAVMYGSGVDIKTVSRDLDKNSFLGKLDKLELQIGDLNRILENSINLVRKELDEKIKKEEEEMYWKWKTLDLRFDLFEKFIKEFETKDLLSKEEFDEFFEEFKKARKTDGSLSVDEIRDYAKQMVQKEIERMWLMIGSMLPRSAQFLDGCKDKIQFIRKCLSYSRNLV